MLEHSLVRLGASTQKVSHVSRVNVKWAVVERECTESKRTSHLGWPDHMLSLRDFTDTAIHVTVVCTDTYMYTYSKMHTCT